MLHAILHLRGMNFITTGETLERGRTDMRKRIYKVNKKLCQSLCTTSVSTKVENIHCQVSLTRSRKVSGSDLDTSVD